MLVELEGDNDEKSAFDSKLLRYRQKLGVALDSVVTRSLDLPHSDQIDFNSMNSSIKKIVSCRKIVITYTGAVDVGPGFEKKIVRTSEKESIEKSMLH